MSDLEKHVERMKQNPEFMRSLAEEGEVTEPGRPAEEVLAPYMIESPRDEQYAPDDPEYVAAVSGAKKMLDEQKTWRTTESPEDVLRKVLDDPARWVDTSVGEKYYEALSTLVRERDEAQRLLDRRNDAIEVVYGPRIDKLEAENAALREFTKSHEPGLYDVLEHYERVVDAARRVAAPPGANDWQAQMRELHEALEALDKGAASEPT